MIKIKKWFWNILIAVDQLFNALFMGDPDETISSRAGKHVNKRRWAKILCKILHPIDKNHCEKSIEPDEGGREL